MKKLLKIFSIKSKKTELDSDDKNGNNTSIERQEKANNKKAYLTQVNSVEVLSDKDYFRFFEFLTYGFVALTCILAIVILSLATSRPNMKFFETNSRGQVQQVFPVGNDSNVLSNRSVQQFVLNAIPESFTFDFNNYNYIFSSTFPKYFSSKSASEIKAFFEKTYIPDIIAQKEFFNISVLSSFVIDTGIKHGKSINEWRIQVPAIINIYNGVNLKHTNVKFQIVVSYTGTTANSYGMKITAIKLLNNWNV